MTKKSKRKRMKRTRKQQTRLQIKNSDKKSSDIKISEAILQLSEQLRNKYREQHRIYSIISITIMAWNISLFPKEEQPHVQGMLSDSLANQLGGEDVAVLLECIDTLIDQKNMLFSNIREYILTHNLSFSGDKITLTVGTAPVPEKIQRRLTNNPA